MLTWRLPSPGVHRARTGLVALALVLATALGASVARAQMHPEVGGIASATIEDLNAAFDSGQLTSERLIEMCPARIEAYDRAGPELNAVLWLNDNALQRASELDQERRQSGPRSPLHGVPVVLKDNIDTGDMPTTGGSALLAGSIPPDDAFIVKKLRDAGAIILAKVNLSELASGGVLSSVGNFNPKNPTTSLVRLQDRQVARVSPSPRPSRRSGSERTRAVPFVVPPPRTGSWGSGPRTAC